MRRPQMSNLPNPTEPPSPSRWRFLVWGVGAAAILALAMGPFVQDQLLYNHSSSMPVGLYLRTEGPVERGAIVTVRAAEVAREYARWRDFTDAGDRFIKRVVGMEGDVACAQGDALSMNGIVIGHRQARDSLGHPLPRWEGCHRLAGEDLLLLGESEDSFDARYWGVVKRSRIEGVWRPLLVTSTHEE